MHIDTIQARLRISCNGLSIHLFDAESLVTFWTANGHRYAQLSGKRKIKKSKVIKKVRTQAQREYTSTIFTKKYSRNFTPY